MPDNESNLSVFMSCDTCGIEPQNAPSVSWEKQASTSPRRRWSLGRLHSTEAKINTNYLERRMTLPLLRPKNSRKPKCELKTLVQNQGKQNESLERIGLNNIFKFWKSEDYLGMLLEKTDVTSVTDVVKICDMVNHKSLEGGMSTTELASLVQDIYKIADLKIRKKIFDNELTIDNGQRTLTKFEERLMRGLHDNVFGKIILEEAESDRRLSNVIEDLSWVTPKHLLAKIDDSDKKLSDTFDKAMLDVATINFKDSPIGKLRCIMNCSKRIFEILKTRSDSSETADDFLSILVFVILQANPARLHSNIRYVLQFGNCEQIFKGEEGYYFTHLCSVVSFVENLSARSLDLSEEEFRQLSSTSSDETDMNKPNSTSKRISCSRQMSLCICKIYHQASETPALNFDADHLWGNSVAIHKQVLVMDAV